MSELLDPRMREVVLTRLGSRDEMIPRRKLLKEPGAARRKRDPGGGKADDKKGEGKGKNKGKKGPRTTLRLRRRAVSVLCHAL